MTEAPRRGFHLLYRWALPAALVGSWAVMLARMWSAFWTLPSAALLERQRPVQPPTLGSLAQEAAFAVLELGLLLLLVWPRWKRLYRLRLLGGIVGTALWFILTTPLAISSVERVHRRWLAFAVLLLGLALVVRVLAAAARWAGRRGEPTGPAPEPRPSDPSEPTSP